MSDDAFFFGLLNAIGRGDKLAEQLLDGSQGSPLAPLAHLKDAGLLDRTIVSDRRFWTGAALGAAAVLVMAVARTKQANASVREEDAPLQNGSAPRKSNGFF